MKDTMSVIGGLVFLIVAMGLIVSGPIMLLWNYCLVPAIPSVQEITFLQAWGLYVLSNFMFKSSISKKD